MHNGTGRRARRQSTDSEDASDDNDESNNSDSRDGLDDFLNDQGPDEVSFIASNGLVTAFDSSYSQLWEREMKVFDKKYATLLISLDHTMLFVGSNASLCCIDIATSESRWMKGFKGITGCGITLMQHPAHEGQIYAAGNGKLKCFEVSTPYF